MTVLHDVNMHERRKHVAGPVTCAWRTNHEEKGVVGLSASVDLARGKKGQAC